MAKQQPLNISEEARCTNADENGSLVDRDGRNWDLGLLRYH